MNSVDIEETKTAEFSNELYGKNVSWRLWYRNIQEQNVLGGDWPCRDTGIGQ